MLQRKPALIAIAAVVVLAAVVTFLVVRGGNDKPDSARRAGSSSADERAGDNGGTGSDGSTSSSIPGTPSTGAGGAPGSTATTEAGGSEPGGSTTAPPGSGGPGSTPTVSTLPTPSEPQGVCGVYSVISAAADLLLDAGNFSDADLVNRAHDLADDLDRATALLRSNAGERYGADAVKYADFLAPVGGVFRAATSRDEVEAAGEILLFPPDDVSEADNRLQMEYDASCQE